MKLSNRDFVVLRDIFFAGEAGLDVDGVFDRDCALRLLRAGLVGAGGRAWVAAPKASYALGQWLGQPANYGACAAGLTALQRRALDIIAAKLRQDRVPPSYAEIQAALGLRGKSQVSRLLDALEERGYVARLKRRARSLAVLVQPPPPAPKLAVVK